MGERPVVDRVRSVLAAVGPGLASLGTRFHALWLLLAFLGSLAFLVGGIHVGHGLDRPAFNVDEAHKLSESYYFHLFAETGDWRHPDWHADFFARTNPPVAKYIFGAALAATGQHVHDRHLQDEFVELWRTPDLLRQRVSDGMLRVTRFVSAVYGALICSLLVGIGWRAAGAFAGLLVGVLLLSNPYFVSSARSGLTDSILLFHLTLIIPGTLHAARTLRARCGRGRLFTRAVVVPGLIIVLATGSKLNGAITAVIHCAGLLLAAIVEPGSWKRPRLMVRCAAASGLATTMAFAILVMLNPTFHDAPVERLLEGFRIFDDWMTKQQIDPGPALFDLRDRAAFVGFCTLRSPALALPRLLGEGGGILMVGAACIGLLSLVWRLVGRAGPPCVEKAHRASKGDVAVILCWVVAVLVIITAWMPVGWNRYSLPATLAISLVAGVAPGVALSAVRSFRQVARSMGASRAQPLAIVLVAVTTALCFATWGVVNSPYLDPAMNAVLASEESFLEAASANRRSPRLQRSAGLIWLSRGRNAEASESFQAALDLLPRVAGARRPWVQRSILLFDLARARAAAQDPAGTARALRDNVEAITQVRASLRSGDPFVLDAFDRLIEERAALAVSFEPRAEAR